MRNLQIKSEKSKKSAFIFDEQVFFIDKRILIFRWVELKKNLF